METYGKVVAMALPVFLGLVILEKLYGMWRGEDRSPVFDSVSSLMSGATNAIKDVLELSISVLSYTWMVEHMTVKQMEASWFMYLTVFIALDFQGYWTHRLAHQVNFFWNKHLIHHSSEEYNLACALRQTLSGFVNLFTFFLLPCALLGVPAIVVATIAPIHLFAQFWYHTRHIDKMGFLEHIIVTPSHHRVHHAINPIYLDKNYSNIFILWDKWFGTFQPELAEEPPVYGITRPVRTFNPIKINFQHLWLLMQDAWRTQSWRDKLAIWFKPTGWRPADVEARYPVVKIADVRHFTKYRPNYGSKEVTLAAFQLLTHLALVSYFFSHIGEIGVPQIYIFGAFFFISVYAFAEWMDGNPRAIWWEIAKASLAFGWIFTQGSWFGIDQVWSAGTECVMAYLVVSVIGCALLRVQPFEEMSLRAS
jgi:alkylglycerol monooxygenase